MEQIHQCPLALNVVIIKIKTILVKMLGSKHWEILEAYKSVHHLIEVVFWEVMPHHWVKRRMFQIIKVN